MTLDQPYYPLRKAESYPLPSHGRLRLVVGGRGEKRTLRIVAEFADEWNATRVDLAGFKHKRRVLAEHCAAFKRDPETIARSLMVPMAIGESPSAVDQRIGVARANFPSLPEDSGAWRAASFLVGSPENIVEALKAWEDAGLERVLLQMLDMDDIEALELFARTVLPNLG